jgi:hypothetical protein
MTLDGVAPACTCSLIGVLQLLWATLLLSGEIIDETARFSRTLVGVRSKLNARFTCNMFLAYTKGWLCHKTIFA